MKKKIYTILLIGLLLRIFLASTSFHADVKAFWFAGEVIAKGNILNFYDYLGGLSKTSEILKVYPSNLFIYPPLFYFFYGPIVHLLTLPVDKNLVLNFLFDTFTVFGNVQFNYFLLAIKIPYLIFDFGIAWIFYSYFKKESNKVLALTLWIFNPINLYATYMMGQFDVIPTFFTVLALYMLVKKNKPVLGAILLGIGACFKVYPILFLVPAALTKNDWKERIKIFVFGIMPYLLSIAPFLGSSGFRSSAFLAGQTTKSFYLSLPISGGESIIVFPLLIIFFYLYFYFRKDGIENLWKRFFTLLLVFFVITHYHPQWFNWLTPFLIIDLVKSKLANWPLVALSLVSWFGLLTFFDPGLTTRIFAPLFPVLQNADGIWQTIGVNFDLNTSRSILQTIFASVGLYYIYSI